MIHEREVCVYRRKFTPVCIPAHMKLMACKIRKIFNKKYKNPRFFQTLYEMCFKSLAYLHPLLLDDHTIYNGQVAKRNSFQVLYDGKLCMSMV